MRYSVHALLVIVLLLSCDSGEKLPTEALPPLTSVAMLEMSFGAENVPDEFIIWRIFGLSVSNLGDICVSQESHVLIFDKNGNPKTILGQQGQGPGDFQRAGSSNVSPTGHLSVSTGMYNRFNIYSPKLDFIKTVNFNINEQYRRFVSEMSRSSLGISEIFAINENDKVVKCKTEITTSESPFFQYDMILYEKYGEIHLLADYNSKSRLRVGSQRGGIPFFGELNCAMLPGNRVAYTHADHDFIIEKNLGYYILNVVSLDNLEVKQIKHKYTPIKITGEERESYEKQFSIFGQLEPFIRQASNAKKYHPHVIDIVTDRNFAFVYTMDFHEIDGKREFLVDVFDVDEGKYIRSAYMGTYRKIKDGYAYTDGSNEEDFSEIQKYKLDPALYGK